MFLSPKKSSGGSGSYTRLRTLRTVAVSEAPNSYSTAWYGVVLVWQRSQNTAVYGIVTLVTVP